MNLSDRKVISHLTKYYTHHTELKKVKTRKSFISITTVAYMYIRVYLQLICIKEGKYITMSEKD